MFGFITTGTCGFAPVHLLFDDDGLIDFAADHLEWSLIAMSCMMSEDD